MNNNLGSAQWANSSEVNEKFRYKTGDFWLGRSFDNESIPLGYQDDRHICLVSGSRGGKGTSIIINNLCLYPGSVVVIDPKGENATVTAARRGKGSEYCEGMGQTVLVLDPFSEAQIPDEYRKCFNPLERLDPNNPENSDILSEIPDEVERLADALIIINKEANSDPIWNRQARRMIMGIILHILTTKEYEGRRNLGMVRNLISRGDWEGVEYLKKSGIQDIPSAHELLWGRMRKNLAFNGVISGIGTRFFDMVLQAPKQYQGVLQAADDLTSFLDSERMQQYLSKSDFKLSDLKTQSEGVSLYLSLPRRFMNTHRGWLRMMISLITTEMERVKGNPATGHPVLMVLDEFAGLDHMKVLEQATAEIAGFGVKLFFVLQSIGQLKEIYKDNWEIFLECSGLKILFNIEGYGSQEYISKLLGDTEIIIESQSENISKGKSEAESSSDGMSYSRKFPWIFRTGKRHSGGANKNVGTSSNEAQGTNKTPQKRELIKPNEIGKRFATIKDKANPEYPGLALIKISSEDPIIVKRVNYYEDSLFTGKFDPHPDHKNNIEPMREVLVQVDGFVEAAHNVLYHFSKDTPCLKWLIEEGQEVKKNQPIIRVDGWSENPLNKGELIINAPESGIFYKRFVEEGEPFPFSASYAALGVIKSTTQQIISEWDVSYKQPAYDVLQDILIKRRQAFNVYHEYGCLIIILWTLACAIGIIIGFSKYGLFYGSLGLISGLFLVFVGFIILLAGSSFGSRFSIPFLERSFEPDVKWHKQQCIEHSKSFYSIGEGSLMDMVRFLEGQHWSQK